MTSLSCESDLTIEGSNDLRKVIFILKLKIKNKISD